MAAQRAIPAKRAREEGASLAAAPELAAASVNQEVERRVRRRVARSTTVPDQGAASSVAAGSKPFTRAAAASQRRPPGLSPVPERLPAKGRCLSWRSDVVSAHTYTHIKPKHWSSSRQHVHLNLLQHRRVVSQRDLAKLTLGSEQILGFSRQALENAASQQKASSQTFGRC